MRFRIEAVAFPYAGVLVAATRNDDGSYTIYENILHSEAERTAAVQELIQRGNAQERRYSNGNDQKASG